MKLIIAANWKMHKTAAETVSFCNSLKLREKEFSGVEVLLCPPYTALSAAAAALKGSAIKLGAQNMSWETEGAYTGEIAAPMLKEFGVTHVILGHSERRHIFGEADNVIRKKLEQALRFGLIPILCVGETGEQRSGGDTAAVLESQLRAALEGLDRESIAELIIAYEPVWAIGTGQAASPADAADDRQQRRQNEPSRAQQRPDEGERESENASREATPEIATVVIHHYNPPPVGMGSRL